MIVWMASSWMTMLSAVRPAPSTAFGARKRLAIYLAFEIADARLARVALDDRLDGIVVDDDVVGRQARAFDRLRGEEALGDLPRVRDCGRPPRACSAG